MNIAVLGSTNGTDLQEIIDQIENDKLKDITISFVLSNKKEAYILERAKKHHLKSIFLNPKNLSREEYDTEILRLVEEHNVELILLIGYMKILSDDFVKATKNKVMNIHPSLLPMFSGGMNKSVHQAVLDYGCKITGCTLMFINEEVDGGPIIIQKTTEVSHDDTVESLKDKVQALEKEAIIEGIELFRDGKIKIEGRKVICR